MSSKFVAASGRGPRYGAARCSRRRRGACRSALVGRRLDRDREEVAGRVAELDRRHDAVGRELAQPVVRAHGDVGALAGRNLLDEVVLDVGVVLADEVDLDAGLVGVRVRRALQRVDALGVDPDGQRVLDRGVASESLSPASISPGRASRRPRRPQQRGGFSCSPSLVCLSQCAWSRRLRLVRELCPVPLRNAHRERKAVLSYEVIAIVQAITGIPCVTALPNSAGPIDTVRDHL